MDRRRPTVRSARSSPAGAGEAPFPTRLPDPPALGRRFLPPRRSIRAAGVFSTAARDPVRQPRALVPADGGQEQPREERGGILRVPPIRPPLPAGAERCATTGAGGDKPLPYGPTGTGRRGLSPIFRQSRSIRS